MVYLVKNKKGCTYAALGALYEVQQSAGEAPLANSEAFKAPSVATARTK